MIASITRRPTPGAAGKGSRRTARRSLCRKRTVLELADRLLPAILAPKLTALPDIAFSVAGDHNGYVPTHNLKHSQPKRHDDPT